MNTTHETHFKACIRETCRYAMMDQLICRTADDKRDNRKDMKEIHRYIDQSATMAMLDSKAKQSDEEPTPPWKPFKLDAKHRRRLQTIIAGSIRAPHRLRSAGLRTTDACNHPGCKGCRATTTHIFWECKHFDRI